MSTTEDALPNLHNQILVASLVKQRSMRAEKMMNPLPQLHPLYRLATVTPTIIQVIVWSMHQIRIDVQWLHLTFRRLMFLRLHLLLFHQFHRLLLPHLILQLLCLLVHHRLYPHSLLIVNFLHQRPRHLHPKPRPRPMHPPPTRAIQCITP